jgi:hypothetical protein
MEPKRGITIRPVELGDATLAVDTSVWILRELDGSLEVEHRDARGCVPRDAIAQSPVPRLPLEELRKRDPCFGLEETAFVVEHKDGERWYSIERCKAHGRRFLRDARGSAALYERVTLLDDSERGSFLSIWSRYHAMSDDWLNVVGNSL